MQIYNLMNEKLKHRPAKDCNKGKRSRGMQKLNTACDIFTKPREHCMHLV